mgnify:CR=1 FL=1|tara:strand:- start:6650 stop:7912 length:1263 start_codon:yes stop_codon:yes gene_type:complete
MASIEITDNTVVRALIRKGTNADREAITLASGELGFATDTGRVFVGNGTDQGGTADGDYLVVGNKYLGVVGSFAGANALPGDTFKLNGQLYARKIDYSGSVADASGYNLLGTAITAGDGIDITAETISVKIDGGGSLEFDTDGALTVGTITLNDLPSFDSNSLLGNFTGGSAKPQIVQVGANSVMGRTSTANLGSITYDDVLFNTNGTGRPTGKPTISGLTVSELGGSGTAALVADSNGTLERSEGTAGTNGETVFTQFARLPRPYQIFGTTTTGTTPNINGFQLTGNGSLTDIDPWATTSISKPAGVKGVLIFGTLDNTVWPTGGNTRGSGPDNWQKRKGLTVFGTTGTLSQSFQPIFSGGAGEEDDGKPELASGASEALITLDSDGNFKIGCLANQDGNSDSPGTIWQFKLYLVGYAL